LYNSNVETIYLSGWAFRDKDDDHNIISPDGIILQSDDYLIIAKDILIFSTLDTTVQNIIGPFDFGLSSTANQIKK